MKKLLYITLLSAASVVSAQHTNVAVLVTTNNFFDLNPDRDAISAVAGNIRLRHTVTDGIEPYDVSAGLPISMTITSREDGWTNGVINTVTNDGVGVVWWVLPPLGAGSYRLQSTLVLPGDSFAILDRNLSVTNPAGDTQVTANVNITNVISSTLIINANGTTVAEIVQP